MILLPQRQESPYTSRRSFLATKWDFPDLAPSPKAAGHPFKRKDVGIKGNLWRERGRDLIMLYLILMGQGRRKRFRVVDSKQDREESLRRKTGPSCDTDAKKAKKKTMKEVYDGEPEMLDTLIFQEHVDFLKIAYERKEMRAVANELKVIDLHVPKVPQQKGSTECGFMVLYFIFRFILAAPASFGTNDYPSFLTAD
ncbi:hypothetical protein Taro_033371 [Colocasia esculenta]|uniref:Ubiquitin-like protease family profile domain-containing protein n=1 Tax=Colocasia esculenta TaxID=4460 RepID=A0A843VV47_COLES|nr:hypothetical protein [Colocasia esculenta]